MTLFEHIFQLTHYRNPHLWGETTAVFTGKSEMAVVRTRRLNYKAYEIVYYADGRKLSGWYSFHPLEDPEEESLRGMEIKIRYKKRKPYIFERAADT